MVKVGLLGKFLRGGDAGAGEVFKSNYYCKLKKLIGMASYTQNSGVKISKKISPILESIAADFEKKYKKKIHVTSGTRDAHSQAVAMYTNFTSENGTSAQRRKYKSTAHPAFDAIAKAFDNKKKQPKEECVGEMKNVIEAQFAKGNIISQHMHEGATDIRTKDLNKKEIDYLIELLKARSGRVYYQDKRNAKGGPHIHIQLK